MECHKAYSPMIDKENSVSVSSESLISDTLNLVEFEEFPLCSFSVSSSNDESKDVEFIKQQMQEITQSLSFKLGKLKKNSAEILEIYLKEASDCNKSVVSRNNGTNSIDNYEIEITAQEKEISGLKRLSRSIEELQNKVSKTCYEIEVEKGQLKVYSDEYEKLKNRLNDLNLSLTTPTPSENKKSDYCKCSTF